MGRIIVGKASEIPPGSMHKVSIDGRDILVVNLDGEFCAVEDTCTHSGASLSEGKLDGGKIICGWHGAEFDCKSGELIKFPAKIRDLGAYKVVVEADDIFVEV